MFFLDPDKSFKSCSVLIGGNGDFGAHFHENAEFVYIKSGSRLLIIDGKEYELFANDLAIIFPCQNHSFKEKESGDCAWIGISPSFLEDYYSLLLSYIPLNPVIRKEDRSDTLTLLLEILFAEKNTNPTYIKGLVEAVLSLCQKSLKLIKRNDDMLLDPAKIICYISENKGNPELDISTASAFFGISKRKMSDWFRSTFFMGFRKFVNKYRINNSAEMLSDPGKTVLEICYESGFENIRTFNRAFLDEFGCSPTKYRKNVLKNSLK